MGWTNWRSDLAGFRDKGAAFIATFWMYIAGWAIVIWAFRKLLELDGHFSKSLGEGSGIDPEIFQHLGWVARFFAALFLVFATRAALKGLRREKRMFLVLGTFCSVIVFGHAVGVGLQAQESKLLAAVAIETKVENTERGSSGLVQKLEAQKADIRADLDAARAPLNAEIERLDTDGKRNEDLGTIQKERRAALEDEASARIALIDAEILAAMKRVTETKNTSVDQLLETPKSSALFVGFAQLGSWSKQPDNWSIYLAGVFSIIFWMLFYELLVIFVPDGLYKMHLRDAALAEERKELGDTVTISRERHEELVQREQNAKQGGKKAATTRRRGNKIEVREEYYQNWIDRIRDKLDEDLPLAEAVQAATGRSLAEVKPQLQARMKTDDFEALFGGHSVVAINTNGEAKDEGDASQQSVS